MTQPLAVSFATAAIQRYTEAYVAVFKMSIKLTLITQWLVPPQ